MVGAEAYPPFVAGEVVDTVRIHLLEFRYEQIVHRHGLRFSLRLPLMGPCSWSHPPVPPSWVPARSTVRIARSAAEDRHPSLSCDRAQTHIPLE